MTSEPTDLNPLDDPLTTLFAPVWWSCRKAYRLVAPGDLCRDMRALPETFTYDLFDILDKYSWFLRPVN